MTTMPTTVDLHALAPDPLEPQPGEVERYVAGLQDLAEHDPPLAKRHAWGQIRLAGVRAARRRGEAHDSLNRMFRLGTPPDSPLHGEHPGIAIALTTVRPVDTSFRLLAGAWMPWLGKRFDSSTQTGDNLLARSARLPLRALWPSYSLQDAPGGRCAAFRFRTYVGPGAVDPDRQTLKIDYDSADNPSLLIRDILDELVQVVPGAYLGKILLRRKGERSLIGYFALRGTQTAAPDPPWPTP
jgi:hypothetical protein